MERNHSKGLKLNKYDNINIRNKVGYWSNSLIINLKKNRVMNKINKNNIPVGMIKTFFTTGKDRDGRKFRIESNSLNYINCINAYSDKIVWVILENNKRIKLY